ncbi:E3 ubiquitin-protein ligase NEURL3 isoform X3 [Globicephala melas]|uniref:E3 ubiquitin-protein ligase NEURL3 isoform X3 n=1 Tax=Globicephala melas TaxID=9731 RepID=UPI00293D9C69|nr:E3 ubiquitin-protein ligase NEURL3 isoform X3 [Globicephala melas]
MTRGPAESFGNLSTDLLQTQAPVSEDPRLMGAQICCQADAEMPREALRFHAEAVGAQVRLDAQRSTARRRATFRDGIVFSQRPVRPGERVELRVLCHECGWVGGLRVGFTRLDPERVTASGLPPFVCPDLEQQSPTWAAMLPDGCGLTGDVVRFWVNRLGRLFAQILQSAPRPQPCRGSSVMRLCLSSKPQQERSVPSASTRLPTPALSPAATHTSAAAVPGGSSGTRPNAPCVAGRLRRWPRLGTLLLWALV